MRVLLVDDEKKFVMMLARRLELRGFRTEFVNSGDEAIGLVTKGESFDVAVLDVKMPGIGGIDLQRKLEKLDPNIKFIFLTGHGSDIGNLSEVGEAALFLPKPLKINDLVEALLVVAGKNQGANT
ncbi:response regulator [Desulfosarcina sp.]|uniref:response regulator n=1 Tax=Desulfosarcina sp. TaxID=2027861 RepID=UPI0039706595